MDVTTLALAVDSTQVNSASTALQKMAGEGAKAESVSTKLTNAAAVQGKTLATGLVPAVTKAAAAYDGIADASKELAASSSKPAAALLGGVTQTNSALAATAAEAGRAAGAVQALSAAVAAIPAAKPIAALLQPPRNPTVQEIAQTPVAARAVSAPMSYREFVSDRMGPLRQQYKEEGLPNQEAHTKAIRQISAEWREYKRIGVDAQTAVTAAAAAAAAALAATAPEIDKVKKAFENVTAAPLDEAMARANAAARLANQSVPAARPAAQFSPFGSLGGVPPATTKGVADLGNATKLTAYQTQQLSFQLNDLFVQMASGQSPLTALIQQGSQLNGTFGGTKGTLSAVASLFTPMRLAIGGTVAAVGALGYAFMKGTEQSKAFADAVVLSGNYAGQTEGRINALAKSVASSTSSSVSSVREYANELIKTGQIGPQVFSAATEAAAAYGKATGKTAQEVAAHFAKMAQDPGKFAEEIDRSMNLFTAAELDAINAMEENGRAADAQGLIYEKLQARLKGLEPNLGTIEKLLRGGKNAWSDFWDAAYGIGRAETIESRIEKLQQQAARASQPGVFGAQSGLNQSISNAANAELKGLQRRSFRESENADAEAIEKQVQKDAKDGKRVTDALLKKSKSESEYKKREAELDRSIKAQRLAGRDFSKEDEKAARDELKKQFAPPKASSAGASEAGQILREQLAEDLSAFKIALAAEKEALAFHQREMQGVYQAGGISLKAFFDDKRATIADGVAAETAQLDKEIARLKEYQAAIKDPSEKIRVGKQIGQVEAEKAKVQTAGERDTKLTNQEEAASFKALNDQIVNYNANLLQMAGDELGAARLRAQVTIDNARILAAQGAKDAAGNPVNVDVSALQRAIAITNDFAEAQRQAGNLAQNTARAEEAAYMVAELGGKSLAEQENAVYAVRSRSLDQLGLLAAKAKELAEASTDPKIKSFAADLALQYAKAAEAVDPALNRLREAQRNLAAGITNSIDSGVATFGPAYIDQRKTARDEIKDERDKYDRKIEILEGYLATTRDKNDQARLREKIKNLEAQKDSVKGESKTSSFLKTVDKQFVQPIAGQALATVNKLLITDPLNEYLKGQFKSLTEGEGLFAGIFKSTMGIKDAKVDPKVLAEQAAATATDTLKNSLTAQTGAVDASRLALEGLANAANAAAGTVGGGNSKPLTVEPGSKQVIPSMGDFTRADRALEASQSASADPATTAALVDARTSTERFADTAQSAGTVVTALAASAAKGNASLGLLPSIVNLFQASVAAMKVSGAVSGGSGGGGILGGIAGLFGKGGGTAAGAMATNSAGMASGQGVSASALANLIEYGLADGGLVKGPGTGTSDSIPAKLSNGEFVVPAKATSAFLPVLEAMRSGDSSASVLGGLLTRLGVKDDEPAVSSALRVHGARELGGPVSAGKLYRVNEKRPELLNVGNKQYLMMGPQGGSIDPNPQQGKGGGQPFNQTINFMNSGPVDHRTQQQLAAVAYRAGVRASSRNN